jgi:hypothetical protein
VRQLQQQLHEEQQQQQQQQHERGGAETAVASGEQLSPLMTPVDSPAGLRAHEARSRKRARGTRIRTRTPVGQTQPLLPYPSPRLTSLSFSLSLFLSFSLSYLLTYFLLLTLLQRLFATRHVSTHSLRFRRLYIWLWVWPVLRVRVGSVLSKTPPPVGFVGRLFPENFV